MSKYIDAITTKPFDVVEINDGFELRDPQTDNHDIVATVWKTGSLDYDQDVVRPHAENMAQNPVMRQALEATYDMTMEGSVLHKFLLDILGNLSLPNPLFVVEYVSNKNEPIQRMVLPARDKAQAVHLWIQRFPDVEYANIVYVDEFFKSIKHIAELREEPKIAARLWRESEVNRVSDS